MLFIPAAQHKAAHRDFSDIKSREGTATVAWRNGSSRSERKTDNLCLVGYNDSNISGCSVMQRYVRGCTIVVSRLSSRARIILVSV